MEMHDSHGHGPIPALKVMTNMFGVPKGLFGRLGGRLMALEHAKIYLFVVDSLAAQSDDRILEVGCGSGAASAIAVSRADNGFVAAVDPSAVMVAQTRRRLRAAIKAGRAEVVEAPAEHLPFEDNSFDATFALFTLHHWFDPEQGLNELRRVLRPGGRLVIAERVHGHGDDSGGPATSEEAFSGHVALLGEIGFAEVECAEHEVGRRRLTVIKARRPK
ncbi:MAG: methyltransferase domain-containing protein [Gaiellaceae bacterium]